MSAVFSPCRAYRYRLERALSIGGLFQGGEAPRLCNFIMLNPSTADEIINDPTVERCSRRAVKLGFDRLIVTNLFAFRSTDPSTLPHQRDPIGPENDQHIIEAAREADLVVCGWGNHGSLLGRSYEVRRALEDYGVKAYALRVTKQGQPEHPIYLPYSLEPARYQYRTTED